MGAKYTTQATAGYDSSPPSDDGAQTATNLITWAGIKSKLTTVLKTFAEAINTSLVNAFDYSVRSVTSSDNTVASDHMRCVEIASTVTTAVTISLGDATTMTNVYRVFVKNSSARNQTVSRVTGGDTIDGVAGSITLPPSAGGIFQTNSSANGYVTVGWFGPISDGVALVSGGTDGTKKVRLEVDGLTTATTRVVTVPDRDITISDPLTLGTEQATTSGTSIDFTSIPSWVKRITVNVIGISTNGTSNIIVQIGDSGGIEVSGYNGATSDDATSTAWSSGYMVSNSVAAGSAFHGSLVLTLEDSSDNTWAGFVLVANTASAGVRLGAGSKATSAVLDRLRLTTVNGTDTFDAGVVNILYE